jgi:hypothetical protein
MRPAFTVLLAVVCSTFNTVAWAGPIPAKPSGGSSFMLITPDEAKLPEAKLSPPRRGFDGSQPSNGPIVKFLRPENESTVAKPMVIKIVFERNLAPIDLSSLKVTYLKLISIDITDRIRPYLTAGGIEASNAEIPEGNHRLRFSISDTQGRLTEEVLAVLVE